MTAERTSKTVASKAGGDAVTEELLNVVRDRLSSGSIEKSPYLLAGLSDSHDVGEVQSKIGEAINRLPGPVGRALRIRAGLDPLFESTLPNKTTRLVEMGRILNGVGQRRVEMLEHEALAPALAIQLGLVEDVRAHLAPPETTPAGAPRNKPAFVQYCNPEMLRVAGKIGLLKDIPQMLTLLRYASRLALLLTDNIVLFPASYLFEVPAFPIFLNLAGPACDMGLFAYLSPTNDLNEYRLIKHPEYVSEPNNPYDSPVSQKSLPGLVWRPRPVHTTAQRISQHWESALQAETRSIGAIAKQVSARTDSAHDSVMAELMRVPERLESRAFLTRFVNEVVDIPFSRGELSTIDVFLIDRYLESYIADLDAIIVVDLPIALLRPSTGIPRRSIVSTPHLRTGLARIGLDEYLLNRCDWTEFLKIRQHPMLPWVIDKLAYHPGNPALEHALAEASRIRHPSANVNFVDAVRTIEFVGHLLR